MIKFFRNIRRQLLGEGKTAKYFKYAFGEILLVMIGILLALQVNNWNENRKTKQQETKLVSQLLEDSKADSIFFESRFLFQKQRDTLLNDLILYGLNPKLDSIGKRTTNGFPFFFRLAYQSNLINNNPNAYEQISNDSIRAKLREYHAKYDYVVHSIDLSNRITEQYGTPLNIQYSKQIRKFMNSDIVQVKDMSDLLKDETVIASLEQFKFFGINFSIQVQNFLVVNHELRIMLNNYLEQKQ